MRLSTQLKRFIAGLMIFTVNLGPIAPVAYSQSANVLEYDANGNLTKDHQNRCYEYNQANQLKRIYDCASTLITIAEYIYGPDGQRLKTVEYYNSGLGTETTYTPNRTTQHAKSTDSGVITWIEDTNYYYANQELVARQDTGGDTTYYHPDHLGSPNLQTNQTGAVVSRQDFSPYGRPNPARTNNLELNNRLQFTGQREDRSGLNYYGARYYSSETRSFTQPDPILPNPYDPQQLNRYAYVRNNPIKYVDPSGNVAFLSPIIDWGWTGKDLIAQQFIKWNPNSTDD